MENQTSLVGGLPGETERLERELAELPRAEQRAMICAARSIGGFDAWRKPKKSVGFLKPDLEMKHQMFMIVFCCHIQ